VYLIALCVINDITLTYKKKTSLESISSTSCA
jgi:hypothetical protein